MQAVLSFLTHEKQSMGPFGIKELKIAVATLWFVCLYIYTRTS